MNKISKLFSLRNIARFSALSLLVSAFSTTDLAAMGANETNVLPVVNVAQQSKSVSGVVADKSGEPIIGANVVVKGANVVLSRSRMYLVLLSCKSLILVSRRKRFR